MTLIFEPVRCMYKTLGHFIISFVPLFFKIPLCTTNITGQTIQWSVFTVTLTFKIEVQFLNMTCHHVMTIICVKKFWKPIMHYKDYKLRTRNEYAQAHAWCKYIYISAIYDVYIIYHFLKNNHYSTDIAYQSF